MGLPIELKVDRELGPRKREMALADVRRACRAYAERFIGVMTEEFQRLGIFGDWQHPYLTMNYRVPGGNRAGAGTVRRPRAGLQRQEAGPLVHPLPYRPRGGRGRVRRITCRRRFTSSLRSPRRARRTRAARIPALAGRKVSVLIWTTTPWTIPSNLAIAFHPEFDYGAYEVDGRVVIIATALAPAVTDAVGRPLERPIARFKGAELEGLVFRHPLYDRDSRAVLGDYVTLEQGTGAVHTAPGHGADDFLTGRKYGLEIYAPVGPDGRFTDEVGLFAGEQVFEANPAVIEALNDRGHLWHHHSFTHQYPHCWRCHNPVIFLATWQWFVRMDGEPSIGEDGARRTLRDAALHAIAEDVAWVPAWGRDRIQSMVANRPDWCISRQRAWGVPIPAVDCTSCGEALLTAALIERAAGVFEQYGADAWYERPIEEFLPEGLACPACGGASFVRERDILDVWFDSGSSHEAVLPFRPELTWPADLYLEGSDQHRGWFQSSLLVGLATRGRPPFREVLTHGFLIDLDGRKMSKSIGNTILPQEIIEESGAEVLRLWVTSTDYRDELRVSKEILARVVEAYRKIRNTCRILVANLYDFDPATDSVTPDALEAVDRYALARYAEAALKMRRAYDAYDFPVIFHALNALVTVDLSAFYVDVSKDRLYTLARAVVEPARSAQTALYTIADGLARLMAPVLPVTAEQLWKVLPGARETSVHMALFPDAAVLDELANPALLDDWQKLRLLRDQANVEIERQRKEKVVGTSLGARLTIEARGDDYARLRRYEADLPTLVHRIGCDR